jgi:hypothetical protein
MQASSPWLQPSKQLMISSHVAPPVLLLDPLLLDPLLRDPLLRDPLLRDPLSGKGAGAVQ